MSWFLLEVIWVVTTPWYWLMRAAARADGQPIDQPLSVYSPEVQPWLDLWARIVHGRPGAMITVRRIATKPPPPPPAS